MRCRIILASPEVLGLLASGCVLGCDYFQPLDSFSAVQYVPGDSGDSGRDANTAEADASPCGVDSACAQQHRLCTESGSSVVCGLCLPSFTEIQGQCVDSNRCQGDQSCNGHGTCDDSSGAIVCSCANEYTGGRCDQCAQGNIHWPSTASTCVDDLCTPDPCSGNHARPGTCSQASATAYNCACDDGFMWKDTACLPGCSDQDGDQHGSGPGCIGPDCNDTDGRVWASGQFSAANVKIGSGGSPANLVTGETVSAAFDYVVVQDVTCSECAHEVLVGLTADSYGAETLDCFGDNFVPKTCPNYSSGTINFTIKAPDNPGTFYLFAGDFQQYNCIDAQSYFESGSAGIQIGELNVAALPCMPGLAYAMNISLNGGRANVTVEPGAIIHMTGDYYVADPGGGSSLQVVVGIDKSAQGCLYAGKPPACGQPGHPGSGTVQLRAPIVPGTHFIKVKKTTQFDCSEGRKNFDAEPPGRGAVVGLIRVQ